MSSSYTSAYLQLPAQLGAYELTERLGAGGMGVVYRGSAPGGTEVAVKVIREAVTSEEETQRRFLREARAAARLDHPNIAQLWDFGRADGLNFLVMELVPGQQLSSWRKSPPPGEHLLPVCFQILDALAYAHARGVIHRDLKPENILIFGAEGEVPSIKLMDFGVAHLRHGALASEAEEEAGFVGTPAYMSPEQARRAAAVTPASDLYALGIMLHEMLAGYLPFRERSVAATLLAQIHAQPPVLAIRPGLAVAGPLKVTIERLLQKRPTDRFMYAADVSAVLAQCTIVGKAEPVVAPELPPPAPLPPAPTRAAAPVSEEQEEEIHFTLQVSHFGTLAESAPAAPSDDEQAAPVLTLAVPLASPPLPAPIAAIFARAWQEPQEALPLMPSEPTRSVFALRETPLVGRLGELARIKTLAAAACRKQRGAAGLLLGEAGMGKSSLLRAAREALEQSGAMQVWSLASEQHETSGRAALVAALTTALGLQTTQRSDWLDHLCDLFPERDRHAWNANQLLRLLDGAGETENDTAWDEAEEFRIVAWVLRKAAVHRPVCLAIDDLHLRDGYLPRLLSYLLREHREGAPWFFLATLDHERMPEGESWLPALQAFSSRGLLDLVRLRPLTEDETRRWAQASLPGQAAFAQTVALRGEGNPRIIASLILHQLDRSGSAEPTSNLPDELTLLLRDRIARLEQRGRLSPESLALAELISVFGEPLPFDLLVVDHRAERDARQADALSLAEALGELLDCQLLQEPEPDLFRFDSRALATLFLQRAEPQLRALHARAARAKLEHFGADQPVRAAELAIHLLAAGQHEAAVRQLLLAARHQARARNFARVRTLTEQALDAIDAIDASDTAEAEGWRVAANALLLESLVQTGEHAAARELGRSLIPQAGDGTELQRRALRTLATSALQSSSPREARTLLELCLASAERAGDEEGRIHILLALGGLELHESRLDASRDWLAQAIVQAQQFDHLLPRVLLEAARAARLADDWDEVEAAASEAERRARDAADPVAVATAQTLLAEREIELGELHRAEALLSAAAEAFAATGSRQAAAEVMALQAHLAAARNNPAEAFLLHANAEAAFAAIGNRSAAAIERAEQALLAAREDNWTLASQLAASALHEDAEQRIDHHRFVRLTGELALLAIDAQQEALAAALLMPTYQKLQRIGLLPVLQPMTLAISRRVEANSEQEPRP
ncbi:MAG: protein kinase [Deltaproteobacteria bacterium]|nr:protein kinase [Deltaproteobacteria bacterium]